MTDSKSANDAGHARLLGMTTTLVAAYLSNNSIAADQLPGVIAAVHDALKGLRAGAGRAPDAPLVPAVPIRKSVTRDFLICLEDGRKLKMLKRHLRTRYDMTPADYRAKWKLPSDYPMVAPAYSEMRATFAKRIGLGTERGRVKPAARKARRRSK